MPSVTRRDFIRFAAVIPFLFGLPRRQETKHGSEISSAWLLGGRWLAKLKDEVGKYDLTVRAFEVTGSGHEIVLVIDGRTNDILHFIYTQGFRSDDFRMISSVAYSKPNYELLVPCAFVNISGSRKPTKEVCDRLVREESVSLIGLHTPDHYPLRLELAGLSPNKLLELMERVLGPDWVESDIMIVHRAIS